MARQQTGISAEHRAGVIRVLVVHARQDLVIGGNIKDCICHIDIIRIQTVQHRLVNVLLRIFNIELCTGLIRFILLQLMIVARNIFVVRCLSSTVFDHVLFILLLFCRSDDLFTIFRCSFCRLLAAHMFEHANCAKQHRTGNCRCKDLPVFVQNSEEQ